MKYEFTGETTYRNGVVFCDLSAHDQELVNQGILEADEDEVESDEGEKITVQSAEIEGEKK